MKYSLAVGLVFFCAVVHADTFTSVVDGPWNDAKTWGGRTADTTAGHVLVVATRVTLDGDVTLGGGTELRLGPGAMLDLGGHTVTLGARRPDRVKLQWVGTLAKRGAVTSTKPGGAIVTAPATRVSVQFDRVDFSSLGDCRFGSHAGEGDQCVVRRCTFAKCGDLQFTFTGMSAASDVVFERCDFRAPTGKRNYLLMVSCSGDAPTGRRTIAHCTFDGEGEPARVRTMVAKLTVEGCVFEDAAWSSFVKPGQKVRGSFFHTDVHNCLVVISCAWNGDADVSDCYLYADGRNPHTIHMGEGKTVKGCVFEADDPEGNHVIASKSITIERCIVLGTGTLFSCVSVNPGPIVIRNNTVYATRTSAAEPMLILTEGRGHTLANCIARNNLLVDADTTDKGEYGVGLVEEKTGQVEADYNNFYGYPGGDVRVHYTVWWRRPAGKPVLAVKQGGHDMNFDPKFVDRKRNLASWDKSIGGPGTSQHAIAELLKLNGTGGPHDGRYTHAALVRYIREGFAPTSPELKGIGAVPVKTTPKEKP